MRQGRKWFVLSFAVLVAAIPAMAQSKGLLVPGSPLGTASGHNPNVPDGCRGLITQVTDVGFEGVKTTAHNFSNATGGGESKRFDITPVLSTKVDLREGCLNAHFSAM